MYIFGFSFPVFQHSDQKTAEHNSGKGAGSWGEPGGTGEWLRSQWLCFQWWPIGQYTKWPKCHTYHTQFWRYNSTHTETPMRIVSVWHVFSLFHFQVYRNEHFGYTEHGWTKDRLADFIPWIPHMLTYAITPLHLTGCKSFLQSSSKKSERFNSF